jgi:hypothetical protein
MDVGDSVGANFGDSVGDGVGGCVGAGVGSSSPPPIGHAGDSPNGSNVPAHKAQFSAVPWHHPVPSSPQFPQSTPHLQQPPPPLPLPVGAIDGVLVWRSVGAIVGVLADVGVGLTPPPHAGFRDDGSKVPVHAAQLSADPWHHPVPSLPQLPQLLPNLQQPPSPISVGAKVGMPSGSSNASGRANCTGPAMSLRIRYLMPSPASQRLLLRNCLTPSAWK